MSVSIPLQRGGRVRSRRPLSECCALRPSQAIAGSHQAVSSSDAKGVYKPEDHLAGRAYVLADFDPLDVAEVSAGSLRKLTK